MIIFWLYSVCAMCHDRLVMAAASLTNRSQGEGIAAVQPLLGLTFSFLERAGYAETRALTAKKGAFPCVLPAL